MRFQTEIHSQLRNLILSSIDNLRKKSNNTRKQFIENSLIELHFPSCDDLDIELGWELLQCYSTEKHHKLFKVLDKTLGSVIIDNSIRQIIAEMRE